jgi:hypothetical protein
MRGFFVSEVDRRRWYRQRPRATQRKELVMSPDTNPTRPPEYRKPQIKSQADAPTDDDRLMIILDLALLLLDLTDITRQLEGAILKLSNAERLAAPSVTPLFRNRTKLSSAERDALEQRAAQKPDASARYYPEYEQARAAVMGMDRDELYGQIDALYGRDNLPPSPSIEELRREALEQTARDFRRNDTDWDTLLGMRG